MEVWQKVARASQNPFRNRSQEPGLKAAHLKPPRPRTYTCEQAHYFGISEHINQKNTLFEPVNEIHTRPREADQGEILPLITLDGYLQLVTFESDI